jgi:hypothetical protein
MKYIAPDGWFSLEYPAGWHEFEDTEDTFLFYNPDVWSGNFRISASRGDNARYGAECVNDDLKQVRGARRIKRAGVDCAYYTENFREQGQSYVSHFWVLDEGEVCIECSFTTLQGNDIQVAECILESVKLRSQVTGKTPEIIPVRVCEISEVDAAYEEISSLVKKKLSRDFTSSEEDIANLQQVVDRKLLPPSQRLQWEHLGITFGTILVNEIDGFNWVTVIEGRKGYAALQYRDTALMYNPAQWVWNQTKLGCACDFASEFQRICDEVEKLNV